MQRHRNARDGTANEETWVDENREEEGGGRKREELEVRVGGESKQRER